MLVLPRGKRHGRFSAPSLSEARALAECSTTQDGKEDVTVSGIGERMKTWKHKSVPVGTHPRGFAE